MFEARPDDDVRRMIIVIALHIPIKALGEMKVNL